MSKELTVTETGLRHVERLLRKVKLNNNGSAEVHWQDTYEDQKSGKQIHSTDQRVSEAIVHDDLKAAMSALIEHLMIACEMVPKVKSNHPFNGSLKGIERYHVSSCTLRGGITDEEGTRQPVMVQIFGRKRLDDGRVVNFGTPNIKLGAPQEPYAHTATLDQHIQQITAEAWAYLAGKMAPPPEDPQMSIMDQIRDAEDVDAEEVLGEEK